MNQVNSIPDSLERIGKTRSHMEDDLLYLLMLLKSYYDLDEINESATPSWLFALSPPVRNLENSIRAYMDAVHQCLRPALPAAA